MNSLMIPYYITPHFLALINHLSQQQTKHYNENERITTTHPRISHRYLHHHPNPPTPHPPRHNPHWTPQNRHNHPPSRHHPRRRHNKSEKDRMRCDAGMKRAVTSRLNEASRTNRHLFISSKSSATKGSIWFLWREPWASGTPTSPSSSPTAAS